MSGLFLLIISFVILIISRFELFHVIFGVYMCSNGIFFIKSKEIIAVEYVQLLQKITKIQKNS